MSVREGQAKVKYVRMSELTLPKADYTLLKLHKNLPCLKRFFVLIIIITTLFWETEMPVKSNLILTQFREETKDYS